LITRIIEASARNRFLVILFSGFLALWGIWALKNTPLDAIPDLSDAQVIIFTDWSGKSPDLVEDQITYPISSTLLSAPRVKAVRGFSFFGSSFIYVIFEEGTDIYWARSRVLEYLQSVRGKLPPDVNPVLGPDASSVGWGFSYAVVDESRSYDLAQLRSLQDWTLKLAIESVPGVSQVASVGGFVRQYQINIDPNRLLAYNIPLMKVMEAVRNSNRDAEGRVLEFSGIEYMIRGRGYIKEIEDLKRVSIGTDGSGTPIYLRDVATIRVGPEIRRGVAELDGKGEVVGGIVVVRFGENVLDVIERVKGRLSQIEPSLPKGVKIVVTYDRSDLIRRSINTLRDEIIKLSVAVSAVCIVFLFHLPSALVVILTLPLAIVISFILMHYLGVTTNIMSLGGIAIAIGAMVDASIIMVENAHKKIEYGGLSRTEAIIKGACEVGPSLFFSLLVITVGFLPIFTLEGQAGRLFKPLAYTKTFAMLFASFLAITLTPVLMTIFIKGRIVHEDKNPVSRLLRAIYNPFAKTALRFPKAFIMIALAIVALTIYPFLKIGREFMPPLNEGTLFYMPVTVPGLSIPEASELLKRQDRLLMKVPEVAQVFGKAGRAETATDPAPPEMFETVINLKPESQWRKGIDIEGIKDELNEAVSMPGVASSFTMPIKARIDMLSTGIRTPVGVKVLGPDISTVERLAIEVENAIKSVKGTRSAYAERLTTGYFLDIDIDRERIARYGLSVEDVQSVIESALGGMNLTTTVEGRERYPVNIRYANELRDDIENLKRVLVPVPMSKMSSAQIPLGMLADIRVKKGPTVIKSEEGLLTSYVYVDFSGRDIGGYVEEAKAKVDGSVKVPTGYRLIWSGEYEHLVSTKKKLLLVVPLTLLIIFILIYMNRKSITETLIVLLAVPFSLVGSFWLLYLLGYNLSIAVWVGIIALAGLDAETGVIMLLYLDLAYKKWKDEGLLKTTSDLKDSIMYGAVKRIRPKIMTVSVILAGLVPILFSTGTGADVMKRIAAPMVGGVVTSTVLELLLYPAIFYMLKKRGLVEN